MKAINYLFCFCFLTLWSLNIVSQGLNCEKSYTEPVSGGPYTTAVADFNKDGFNDLIYATNSNISNIILRINDGSGQFLSSLITNTVSGSGRIFTGICAADFNSDSYTDFVISISSNTASTVSELQLFLNNGGAGTSFSLAPNSPCHISNTNPCLHPKARFINNDTLPDILFETGGPAFATLINTGSGNFSPVDYTTGGGITGGQTETYDFNSDGNLDVVVTGLTQNTMGLFLGSPSGTFAIAPTFPMATGNIPRPVDFADFNKDGLMDILIGAQGNNRFEIYYATSSTTFSTAVNYTVNAMVFALQAGDFNNDGNPDFAGASFNNVYYFVGNGAGTFTTGAGFPKGGGIQYWSALKANLNSDTIPELILSDRLGTGKINVFSHSGILGFSSSTTQLCQGDSTTINITTVGPNSYTWQPGNFTGTSNLLKPTSSTAYSVTGVNTGNGCGYSGTFTINVNPNPNLSVIASPSVICAGENSTLTVSGTNSYSWASIGSDSSIVVSPTASTTYTVSGTNYFGCAKTDTIQLIVSPCIGIKEINQEEKIIFYPNPANNHLNIMMDEKFDAEIFSLSGEKLLVGKYNQYAVLDISHLSPGMYLLKIHSGDKSIVRKWIKN